MSIFEVAHGGEGHIDDAVNVVIARLHLGAEDADDFKADAIKANMLAESVATGEKLFFGLGANDSDTSALVLIFGIEKASLVKGKSADGESIRVFPVDTHSEGASVVLNIGLLKATGSNVSNLRDVGGEEIDVFEREADGRSSFLAARLHG